MRVWIWHAAICLVLFLIVGVAYRNSFHSVWVLDNKTVIQLDPRNKEATLENLKLIWEKDYWWPTLYTRAYRPVVSTTYWLNWSVLENGKHAKESDQVVGFHWVNLIAHGVNAVLVYCLMLKLLRRQTSAFLIAGMFALHPVATEAVTNIIGRADEFMAASFLGCTLLYIRSTEVTGWRRLPWLLALMVLLGAGLLSKESATAFYGIPFLYDVIYRWTSPQYQGRRARRILSDWLVYAALSLPLFAALYLRSLVFAHAALPRMPFLDNPIFRLAWDSANSLPVNIQNWIAGRMTAFNIAAKALWKLVWPVHLSSDYSYSQITLFDWQLSHIEDIKAILGMCFVAGTLTLALWCYKRYKVVSFLILFFWVAYGPTSNFITESSTIFAERFLYVPSVAFCALVVMGAEALVQRIGLTLEIHRGTFRNAWPRLAPHGMFLAILVLYGFRTYNRNFDWRSDITLSQSAIKESPRSFRGYFTLARAYHELDRIGRIDEVIKLGETGLAIVDRLPDLENSSAMYLYQGMYYGMKGETVATRSPEGFLVMNDRTQQWYEKSARVLERASEIDVAANKDKHARSLRRGEPQGPDTGAAAVYMYLGMAYERLGLDEKALQAYMYMRHIGPREPLVYSRIGFIQFALRRYEDAAISFMQCIILDPEQNDAWQALVDIYSEINKEPLPAIDVSDGRPRLREDNKMIQEHRLRAYRDLLRIARAAQNAEMAQAIRESAASSNRLLDPALLDDALESSARPAPPAPVFHTYGKKLFP